MKIYKKTIVLTNLLALLTLAACSTFQDVGKVLRNEKIRTNDEFLIEKKEPLVVPPNANELPKPESKSTRSTRNPIKKILKSDKKDVQSNSEPSSIEDLIISEIKKWKIEIT